MASVWNNRGDTRIGQQVGQQNVYGNIVNQSVVNPALFCGALLTCSFRRCRPGDEDESRLLKLLPYAAQAAFNSSVNQYKPLCLNETRVDVLETIKNWGAGLNDESIFWLNGMAGTGKSTIARTVAHIYNEQKQLGASFFFSRDVGDLSDAGKFFTSIAVQLARRSPILKHHICHTDPTTNGDRLFFNRCPCLKPMRFEYR